MHISLIEKSIRVATSAHEGQTRKGDEVPYITHPFMVAMKLTRHGFSDTVVSAALVHDVLEDTEVSEEELRRELGDAVVDIVLSVTNDDTLSWEEKKKRYIETVRGGG